MSTNEISKVTDETHKKFLRVIGALQAKNGKRKTLEDAVQFMLDEYERETT